MRRSKADKADTHKRIVAIAAKRFREEGLAGIGIAELMKEAGLTVGGFYKHFQSRDALVAEAVGCASEIWKNRVAAADAGGPRITYESLVDDYLSETHRDHPGEGCPVGALAGDLARSDRHTRDVATRKIRANVELLARLLGDKKPKHREAVESRAILTFCAMVGAISVARAVSDKKLSRQILKAVAGRLKNSSS